MTIFLINSPLEQFEVVNLIGLNAPILGHLNILLTNLALYSSFIFLVVIGLQFYGNNDNKIIPNNWSISFESSFASLNTMVKEQIGIYNEKYLPFIYSLYITLALISLLFLVFAPFLINNIELLNNNVNFLFEIRFFIIYIASILFIFS